MSEKKEKIIYVNKLILHAKNVEIIDAEKVDMNRANNTESNNDQIPMRDPWGLFWGRQPREEVNQREGENESLERDNQ